MDEKGYPAFDSLGLWGVAIHYAFILFFVGLATLFLLLLWRKGRLDMDEEPKWMMMEEEDG